MNNQFDYQKLIVAEIDAERAEIQRLIDQKSEKQELISKKKERINSLKRKLTLSKSILSESGKRKMTHILYAEFESITSEYAKAVGVGVDFVRWENKRRTRNLVVVRHAIVYVFSTRFQPSVGIVAIAKLFGVHHTTALNSNASVLDLLPQKGEERLRECVGIAERIIDAKIEKYEQDLESRFCEPVHISQVLVVNKQEFAALRNLHFNQA